MLYKIGMGLLVEAVLFLGIAGISFSQMGLNVWDFYMGRPIDLSLSFHQLIWASFLLVSILALTKKKKPGLVKEDSVNVHTGIEIFDYGASTMDKEEVKTETEPPVIPKEEKQVLDEKIPDAPFEEAPFEEEQEIPALPQEEVLFKEDFLREDPLEEEEEEEGDEDIYSVF